MLYSAVERLLEETIGLNTESTGKLYIEHVVNALMERSGLHDVDSFVRLLQSSPEEIERLIENVVVHETWFFRDIEPFVFLKQYVQENWLPGHQGEVLRVLSVPCSTGEEPYSIAISLLEAGLSPDKFYIDAADISKKGIAKAMQAVFNEGSFRGKKAYIEKGEDYQNLYFQPAEHGFMLGSRISGLVHFFHDNLLNRDFLANHIPYHIIFCRNLLIYLTDEARKKILSNLDRLIFPGGLLFTGHAELLFFRQYGYDLIHHPLSFACRKSGQPEKKTASRKQKKIISRERKKPAVKVVSDRHTSRLAAMQPVETRQRDERSEKVRESFPEVSELIEKKEELSESVLTAARSLADRGDLKKAYSLCESYVKENRANAEVYFLMGLICHARHSISSAEDSFLKSIYLNPHYYEPVKHLSLLYEKKGDTAKSSLFKERAERIQRIMNCEL